MNVDTYIATREKWEGTFSSVDEGELGVVVGALSDRIIIPTWFDRKLLEEVFGCSISREKYADFRNFLEDNYSNEQVFIDVQSLWRVMNKQIEEVGPEV